MKKKEHTRKMKGNCQTGGTRSFNLCGTNLVYRFLGTGHRIHKHMHSRNTPRRI